MLAFVWGVGDRINEVSEGRLMRVGIIISLFGIVTFSSGIGLYYIMAIFFWYSHIII